uniref:Carboxylic ester hydrolase n=1 Tax=Callorhinchus milii TaxID=7868 RepID=A0A4W3IXU2_CALMI
MSCRVFLCLVLASHLGAALGRATLGVVHTEGGFVEGTRENDGLFRSVDIFRGIPFAAPPKRFEKAEPHPGWNDVLKTKKFKDRCLQTTLRQTDVRGSEDCLYLNIWIPQGSSVSTNLPVMVWIFGGGFLAGASQGANFLSNYLYDGFEIATRGQVIVVTLSYRVGPLGFLSTGDSNSPGNYGLWDQHMAIGWVKRNIAAFGGDPENITLFGESAGGASVSLQTLTPYNKGLINRAISQSGVALCPWSIQRSPLQWAEEVALKVGCPVDNNATMMACLRTTDPKAITLAIPLPFINLEQPLAYYLIWSPVIDGDFIPDDPKNLYHNAATIDYIAGVNDMDGHIFVGFDVHTINQPNLIGKTYPYVKDLGEQGANLTYAQYTKSWPSNPNQDTIKQTVVNLETDILFLIPTQLALELHYKHAQGARTYSYVFTHPSRAPIFPSWTGADHADDLQYVFGKPYATPLAYWPRDRDVTDYFIAYWTNFAYTGDPSNGNSKVPTPWTRYSSMSTHYLDINSKVNLDSMKQMLRADFVHFWNQTYVEL